MLKTILLSSALSILPMVANAQHADHDAHDHHHHHQQHEENKLGWVGHLDTRTYFTDIYSAEEKDEEISDIFTHSHADIGYYFNNGLSIQSSILLEGDPAGHSHGGGATRTGDRFFDDHPLFIEQLKLAYDTDNFGIYAGKFNPEIGKDVHDVQGWFGPLVFEEFDIRERVGFGGYINGDIEKIGQQRLDLSTFFADTSFLSESLLYDRDTLDKGDGGVANTQDLSSFALNLSGELGSQYLSYYAGYVHQSTDLQTEDDETRLVIGLDGHYDITPEMEINAMIDMTDINHLGGEVDHDRTYSTIGLGINYNHWVIGGTYTDVNNQSPDPTEGMDGRITQFSVGYNFDNGFGIDVGHQTENQEGETSDRLGGLIRYHADF